MAKIYFNPKYHNNVFFRVLPLLFEKVYFNGEHANFDDYLISLCEKKIVVPIFNSTNSIPHGIQEGNYLSRTDIVPEDDYRNIMDELYAIGPKLKFARHMVKEYSNEELKDLFDITNWDLTIATYLGAPELSFEDMITLRRKMLVETTNPTEETRKPLAVTGFLQKRNFSLPIDLRENDINAFRQEKLFTRFNEWVDEKITKHETHPNYTNIDLPEVMVKDYEQLLNNYSSRRTGQGVIAGTVLGLAAIQMGVPPAMGVIATAGGGTIASTIHRFFAREKWVYWVMNVESVKRNE